MKIHLFELNQHEKDLVKSRLPDAILHDQPLMLENIAQFADAECIAPFISSHITAEIIEKLPNLKLITTRSTGFDHIDIAVAKQKSVTVCNVPEYGSRTVAEFTFGLLLTLTRKIHTAVEQSRSCNFNTSLLQGIDLFGKTFGIIGLGRIGIEVDKIAHGFGMTVIVYTEFQHQHKELVEKLGIQYVSLDELLSQSDVISLHLPLTPETTHILNQENFAKCKKGAYLINTARGGLIETEALIKALENGTLAGAGLDVLEEERAMSEELEIVTEPDKHEVNFKNMCIDHVLIQHPKVIVTPHNAFNTIEALERILETTIQNIEAFSKGTPVNIVS